MCVLKKSATLVQVFQLLLLIYLGEGCIPFRQFLHRFEWSRYDWVGRDDTRSAFDLPPLSTIISSMKTILSTCFNVRWHQCAMPIAAAKDNIRSHPSIVLISFPLIDHGYMTVLIPKE